MSVVSDLFTMKESCGWTATGGLTDGLIFYELEIFVGASFWAIYIFNPINRIESELLFHHDKGQLFDRVFDHVVRQISLS